MSDKGFGQETEIQVDPLNKAGIITRRVPSVKWTDADGDHELDVETQVRVGSSEDIDLRLADPKVSRLHAELKRREDGLWVRDLGSRNGTYVDGIRVVSARIPDGSKVTMGDTELYVTQSPVPTQVELWKEASFGPLVGTSPIMRELFLRLARIAPLDDTVLVEGETGTGKEAVARAIHDASPRAEHPFVVVDCGALPENLLEAELFGYAKGAFTGAEVAREGQIAAAGEGTVFLDEIGEMPIAMQPKLLRVMESRTFRPLGSNESVSTSARFIAATHRDLGKMVNDGSFREDLYFRICVLPLVVPSLGERLEDVPLLVKRFLPENSEGSVSPELMRELSNRQWPGNVRELRNFVNRAVALGADAALSMPQRSESGGGGTGTQIAFTAEYAEARDRAIADFEREYVRELLKRHDHNVKGAAEAAGINRTYLHKLIKKHQL